MACWSNAFFSHSIVRLASETRNAPNTMSILGELRRTLSLFLENNDKSDFMGQRRRTG